MEHKCPKCLETFSGQPDKCPKCERELIWGEPDYVRTEEEKTLELQTKEGKYKAFKLSSNILTIAESVLLIVSALVMFFVPMFICNMEYEGIPFSVDFAFLDFLVLIIAKVVTLQFDITLLVGYMYGLLGIMFILIGFITGITNLIKAITDTAKGREAASLYTPRKFSIKGSTIGLGIMIGVAPIGVFYLSNIFSYFGTYFHNYYLYKYLLCLIPVIFFVIVWISKFVLTNMMRKYK